MQIKVSTDYAIRIVLYLAITNRITPSKELSDKLCIPQSIVLKIGKKLSYNSIVKITTGVVGGFELQKQPEDISMFDIINMFEPTTKLNRCLEEDKYCSRFATECCPVRKFYCKAQKQFEDSLKSTTIAELL
ncbi:Rrf2 family transcriptional regulator [Clostridioides difficile]|nr:Rrf2 family transcriptional regulator [Clostridioides difficile]MCA0538676.1 Rrf2 family transcriptional regulator [Clostridioides difficile]MCA0729621.1 Rrf2 family transcriptional regulator [Clostridioides difficile]MCR1511897.1 Rrf2 family transcriptional regulator [Clostridioides difficile]MDN9631327.1 Rrf2 family transcriptional regulator [Clostridioides difficile]